MTQSPRSTRVIVFGAIHEDYILNTWRRPRAGETISGATFHTGPGGKGANQAVALARLGCEVELIARVGDDVQGKSLLSALHAEGVDVTHAKTTRSHATGSAFITVTPEGENSILVAPGADAAVVGAIPDLEEMNWSATAALILQLEVPLLAVFHAISAAGPSTLVVLNAAPAITMPRERLQRVDILVVNELEATFLLAELKNTGVTIEIRDTASAQQAAQALCEIGPTAAVITLGAKGAVAAVGDQTWSVEAPAVGVVDTTGAGDLFIGALVSTLVHSGCRRDAKMLIDTLPQALQFAVGTASQSVGRPGIWSSFPRRVPTEVSDQDNEAGTSNGSDQVLKRRDRWGDNVDSNGN